MKHKGHARSQYGAASACELFTRAINRWCLVKKPYSLIGGGVVWQFRIIEVKVCLWLIAQLVAHFRRIVSSEYEEGPRVTGERYICKVAWKKICAACQGFVEEIPTLRYLRGSDPGDSDCLFFRGNW